MMRIPISEFYKRTDLTCSALRHAWKEAQEVVALRDLASVDAVQIMSMDYLQHLLSHVVLAGGNRERVYEHCSISIISLSPKVARIGQTFVQKDKCLSMLENIQSLIRGFATPSGPLKIGAFIALGRTKEGICAIAHYLPPIAEMNGSSAWNWLDGIHRGYLHVAVGAEIPTIAIDGVKAPFPCDVFSWDKVQQVDQKPPREERFFNLKPDLFRDLSYVGIDG